MSDQSAPTPPTREPHNSDDFDAKDPKRYEANKKSVGLAYLCWFFFGLLGGHRFYLKRYVSGFIMILFLVIGIASCYSMIQMYNFTTRQFDDISSGSNFLATLMGASLLNCLVIWLFVDMFLIPSMTRKYNAQLASQISASQ